jgi:hypothetical protein
MDSYIIRDINFEITNVGLNDIDYYTLRFKVFFYDGDHCFKSVSGQNLFKNKKSLGVISLGVGKSKIVQVLCTNMDFRGY